MLCSPQSITGSEPHAVQALPSSQHERLRSPLALTSSGQMEKGKNSDPADVGSLISSSSAFSKTSLNIWKFMVLVLLKPGLPSGIRSLPPAWGPSRAAEVGGGMCSAGQNSFILSLLFSGGEGRGREQAVSAPENRKGLPTGYCGTCGQSPQKVV